MRNDVTRFPDGITNAASSVALAAMGLLDPTKYHVLYEEFDRYLAADWVVTETQAGATQALTTGDGGLLLITNSAADDDIVALQWAGSAGAVVPTFSFSGAKRLAFGIRFQTSDATQSDIIAGLYIADTSPVASNPASGIYLLKADGAATYVLKTGLASAFTTSSAIGSIADATNIELVWVYEGQPRVDLGVTYYDFLVFANGVQLATVACASTTVPTADIALSFAIQNGEAVAKTMTVDWVFAIKER